MSEDKIEIDVEQAAEAFTDELSDEALDRLEGAFCACCGRPSAGSPS
jgi:hypothetical protein